MLFFPTSFFHLPISLILPNVFSDNDGMHAAGGYSGTGGRGRSPYDKGDGNRESTDGTGGAGGGGGDDSGGGGVGLQGEGPSGKRGAVRNSVKKDLCAPLCISIDVGRDGLIPLSVSTRRQVAWHTCIDAQTRCNIN